MHWLLNTINQKSVFIFVVENFGYEFETVVRGIYRQHYRHTNDGSQVEGPLCSDLGVTTPIAMIDFFFENVKSSGMITQLISGCVVLGSLIF